MDTLKEGQNNQQSCAFGLMRTMVNLCQKDVELGRDESEIQLTLLVGFFDFFFSFFISSCIHY